jgi:hypothetical protein
MACKGKCIHYKAFSRYATGHKRCQICELFVKWDGVFCPCCGRKLRIGPRSFKLKAKLRKQKEIQEANKKVLYRLYDLEKEISVTNIVRN